MDIDSKTAFRKIAREIIEGAHGEILGLYGCSGDSHPEVESEWEEVYNRLISLIELQIQGNTGGLYPARNLESLTKSAKKQIQEHSVCKEEEVRPYVERAISVLAANDLINKDGVYCFEDAAAIVNKAARLWDEDNPY